MAMSVGMLQLGHGLGEFCHSIPYPISMFGNSPLASAGREFHTPNRGGNSRLLNVEISKTYTVSKNDAPDAHDHSFHGVLH